MKYLSLLLILTACGPKGDGGIQGVPGQPGQPGTVITAQPFCPSIPGVVGYGNQEGYITLDSKVYAVYYDGTHTFLTLLLPGNYQTTDGRDCHFTVNSDGSVN